MTEEARIAPFYFKIKDKIYKIEITKTLKMNPFTYALCQKPVLSVAMWVTGLCAFPPLFSNLPIDLTHTGALAITEFKVNVPKSYHLSLTVEFESVQKRVDDLVVGNAFNQYCVGTIKYNNIPVEKRIRSTNNIASYCKKIKKS